MSDIKNPAYKVLLPVWSGGESQFCLDRRQLKSVLGSPNRIAPVNKSLPVHERASTCESILGIYPNAISVGGVLGAGVERGDVAFGAWMTAAGVLMSLWTAIRIGLDEWFPWVTLIPSSCFFSIVSIYFFRSAYLLPRDNPILFNKSTQEVTFSQIKFHRFWKFWSSPGFLPSITVPWKSIQARSYKFTQYMGTTLRDSYRLELWAPTADDPKRLLVKESIGYLGSYEDEKLWQVYEHIRRYMEEGGPPIQHGEELRKPRRGRDLPPFVDSVLATLGGPALTDEEVRQIAEKVPPQYP